MKKETKQILKNMRHEEEYYEMLRWLRKNKIYKYEINSDFSIDVHDSVCLVGEHDDFTI